MMNMDIFQLFFNYLEDRPYNNIHQNVNQDADYLETTIQENELSQQYRELDLLEEQRKIITLWIEAIQAQQSVYTTVVFRMGIQVTFDVYCIDKCNYCSSAFQPSGRKALQQYLSECQAGC